MTKLRIVLRYLAQPLAGPGGGATRARRRWFRCPRLTLRNSSLLGGGRKGVLILNYLILFGAVMGAVGSVMQMKGK